MSSRSLKNHSEFFRVAAKPQREGSQTCNVWNRTDENVSALKTRKETSARIFNARTLTNTTLPDVARLATFCTPLARLKVCFKQFHKIHLLIAGCSVRTVCALLSLLFALSLLSCAGRNQLTTQTEAKGASASSTSESLSSTSSQSRTQLPLTPSPRETHVLRVCSDPNNLPFSNSRGEGFENKIAELIAREMNARVEYTWWAQRRGFFRNTLKAGDCDLVMGVPSNFEMALTTAPYYRSTYVFVTRKDKHLNISSFDDPILRKVKIGVQMVGDDFANTPPAHALATRRIIDNVEGFTLYGDYKEENPPARIMDAVAKGEVDVAIVWGPLAGYFALRERVPLEIVPVSPQIDGASLPFVFDISLGVRRGDQAFKDELEQIIESKRAEIDSILDAYGVPRVEAERPKAVS